MRYPYPHRSSGSIASSEVCREWLLQRAEPNWFDRGSDSPLFPFLNAGTFIGRAVSVLRIIRIMLRLYQQTGEIDDQALFGLHGGFRDALFAILRLRGFHSFITFSDPWACFKAHAAAESPAGPRRHHGGALLVAPWPPVPRLGAVPLPRGLLGS